MTKYATRVWNDDYEEKGNQLMSLANTYGCEDIKDRGRIVFFLFSTRQQALGFADEVFEGYKINTKVIEWF